MIITEHIGIGEIGLAATKSIEITVSQPRSPIIEMLLVPANSSIPDSVFKQSRVEGPNGIMCLGLGLARVLNVRGTGTLRVNKADPIQHDCAPNADMRTIPTPIRGDDGVESGLYSLAIYADRRAVQVDEEICVYYSDDYCKCGIRCDISRADHSRLGQRLLVGPRLSRKELMI